MAAPLPFFGNELGLLGALLRHKVRFMIVGLSAAALQGAPVVTQDVDLWFERVGEENISGASREVGAAYVPPSVDNPLMLAGAGAELFDVVIRMDGLRTFAEEFKTCVEIPLGGYRVKVLALDGVFRTSERARQASLSTVGWVYEELDFERGQEQIQPGRGTGFAGGAAGGLSRHQRTGGRNQPEGLG